MHETSEQLYDALADGTGEVPADPRLVGALRQRVVDAQRSGEVEDRRRALAVCVAMVPRGGLEWMHAFAEDPDADLRRATLDAAEAQGPEGMAIVRAFIADPEPALSLRVLARLTERAERTATTRVRSLLGAEDPRVRASAAHLLGYIAGQVVRPQLDALVRDDPAPIVRDAAAKALERIEGTRSRDTPTPWSESDLVPADVSEDRSSESNSVSESEPGPERETSDPTSDLVRAIGAGDTADADALASFRSLPDSMQADLLSEARSSSDDASRIGIARAVAATQRGSWVGDLRRQLTASSPRVRAAAVAALSGVAGPAVLPAMSRLLRDPEPMVVRAAVDGIVAAATRHDVPHMARQWLGPLASGEDDIADYVTQALASLE